MTDLVQKILNAFVLEYDTTDSEFHERVKAILPVDPNTDVFLKMTNLQMESFKNKLADLKETLEYAESEVDPHEACDKLNTKFGDDFPIPPKDDTGKKNQKAAISFSSGSA